MLFYRAGYRNNGLDALLLVKLANLEDAQKHFRLSHGNYNHYCYLAAGLAV